MYYHYLTCFLYMLIWSLLNGIFLLCLLHTLSISKAVLTSSFNVPFIILSDRGIFIIAHISMNLESLTALRFSVCVCVCVCVCVSTCINTQTDLLMKHNTEWVRAVQKSHTQITGQIVELFEAEKTVAQHNEYVCQPFL